MLRDSFGHELALDFMVDGEPRLALVCEAAAKAREFEKWCGQNEGDNSAPHMLKDRPAIVPLKTEV